MTSTNRKVITLCADGYAIEFGTGTSGTGVTYDVAFDSKPTVVITMTASGGGDDDYLQTETATGHTLTTTTAKAYNYIAIGPRQKKPGR